MFSLFYQHGNFLWASQIIDHSISIWSNIVKLFEQLNMATNFESMSNELLMDLFEYYDLYTLFMSFSSLNSRIDHLLRHCQVHVDLDLVQPTDFIRFLAHILPQVNVKNIRSLHASKEHQIKVLADDQSLDYFNQLHSLDLSHIPSNLLQSMVSRISFSHLQRLKLDIHEGKQTKRWSYSQYFLDSNNCHRLRTYNDVKGTLANIPSVLSIEHLTIGSCTPHHFLSILKQSPYLKCFRTALDFTNRSPHFVASYPVPCSHALTQLHISPYGSSQLSALIYLLQCVPRLRHLRLRAQLEGQPDCVDPVFWQTFFHTHLLELKQLSLCVDTIDCNSSNNPIWNYLTDSEAIAKQMAKSNYWSCQRWKATFRSHPPSHPGGIYWAEFKVV